MRFAYVFSDPLENPEVLADLKSRLDAGGITMALTDKPWQEIYHPVPFLYFRTPYLRFEKESMVLDFHIKNAHIPFIQTANREIISISPFSTEVNPFVLNMSTYHLQPSIAPLPILLGTHCRATYLQLTINSLYNSISDPRQKIYIVASQPDEATLKIVKHTVNVHANTEAVVSQENLKYSFANFGSKFFNLPEFVHFEDDGIIPDSLTYHVPFWTSQLAHRATTADIVAIRTSEINWASEMFTCGMLNNKPLFKFDNRLWHYLKKKDADKYTVPLGGIGFVIKSKLMYQDFDQTIFATSDQKISQLCKSTCLLNVPIYHIGANQKFDYPGYNMKKVDVSVARFQLGTNMRSQEQKTIDLAANWGA